MITRANISSNNSARKWLALFYFEYARSHCHHLVLPYRINWMFNILRYHYLIVFELFGIAHWDKWSSDWLENITKHITMPNWHPPLRGNYQLGRHQMVHFVCAYQYTVARNQLNQLNGPSNPRERFLGDGVVVCITHLNTHLFTVLFYARKSSCRKIMNGILDIFLGNYSL